jgi:4-amino-4-deoxy-L-arabinose transferase-like glycosyltransferase
MEIFFGSWLVRIFNMDKRECERMEFPFPRHLRYLSWGIILSMLIFNLLTIGRVPDLPQADDGGYAAAAYQFWQTGHPGVPGYRILNLNQDVFVFGRTAAAFQGIFMPLFGISLWAALLPSFFAGIGLLWATYAFGRILWGNLPALLGTAILASSGIFFLASHYARPDLLLACYWMTSLYLMAAAPPGKCTWIYFICGLIMGMSGDVHLNGFLLAPIPLLFGLILRPESLRLRLRIGAIYIGGAVLGAMVWLTIHYWPDRHAFIQQVAVLGAKSHGIRILRLGLFGALEAEINRYLSWFWAVRFHRHLFEGIIIFVCAVWLLWGGERRDRALIVSWLGVFGAAVLMMFNHFHYYLILVWPLFALWTARVLLYFYQTRFRQWTRGVLFALFTAYFLNLGLWAGKAYLGPSYNSICQELRYLIPPQTSVVAGGEWWFALYDRDFTDAQYLCFQGGDTENSLAFLGNEWQRVRWQFAVASGDIRILLDQEVPISEALALCGAKRELEVRETRAFAIKHGRILRRIATASTPVLVMKLE